MAKNQYKYHNWIKKEVYPCNDLEKFIAKLREAVEGLEGVSIDIPYQSYGDGFSDYIEIGGWVPMTETEIAQAKRIERTIRERTKKAKAELIEQEKKSLKDLAKKYPEIIELIHSER